MDDRPPIEQRLLAILESQNPSRKKYHRLREAYSVISEMMWVGYRQVDINQLVNEGGLPLHFETFKTYLRRCRCALDEKTPTAPREIAHETFQGESVADSPPPAVERENVPQSANESPRSLDDIFKAREAGDDASVERYMAAKKPLRSSRQPQ